MRTVKVFEEAWPLHTPFVIARGSRSEARVVVVELEEEGIKGTGECTPYPRYGEMTAEFTDGQVKDYGVVYQDYGENLWNMVDAIREDTPIFCTGD